MGIPATTTPARGSASRRRPAPLPFEHRPPLDGIRAIAALLVVFFHAGTPVFDHGYVGVDVFFVLSGFLITSLLARELLGTGRVRFVAFYARRVRRLLPAALFVLLVTAVAYELIVSQAAVAENREGFVASALYVANWFFLSQSHDYFAADNHPSPVEHYWSLSVEEQFYVVWPALLLVLALLARRYRFRIDVATGALALAGIIFAGALTAGDPMGSYLGTPARAYQLLLGAAVAFACLRRERHGRDRRLAPPPWAAPVAAVGLVLMLVAGTALLGTGSTYVHGLVAALATSAVLLGLELRPASGAARVLAWKPALLLGLWSYAVYLWHWPVVVLGDEEGILPDAWLPRTVIVLSLTTLLAWGTYVLLERPTRRISLRTFPRQRLIAVAGLAGAIAIAFLFPPILRIDSQAASVLAHRTASAEDVVAVAGGGKSTVLLVGDSHAQTLYPALESLAKEQGWRLVPAAEIACPWARVAATDDAGVLLDCERMREKALRAAKRTHPDIALLVSRSILVRPLSIGGRLLSPGTPEWFREVERGTQDFLGELRPLVGRIVIVEPFPETSTSMIDCLANSGSPASCSEPSMHLPGTEEIASYWRSLPNTATVSLDGLICPRRMCPAVVDGVQTHVDTNHLTIAFSRHIAPRLDAYLRGHGIFLARGEAAPTHAVRSSRVESSGEPTT